MRRFTPGRAVIGLRAIGAQGRLARQWRLALLLAGITLLLAGSTLLLAACSPPATAPAMAAPSAVAAVEVAAAPLLAPAPCTGAFVAHDLDHTTQAPNPVTRLFDSNGSGLAVNDLDGDGAIDIVLANLAGPATVLWNEGGLRFTRQPLTMLHRTRAAASVDVDGDGRLDLVFTNGSAGVAAFRSLGGREFAFLPLPGVTQPAYAMNWGDLNGDGTLDLVTGAYDAARMVESSGNALFAAAAGVNIYRRAGDLWQGTQLTTTAQALAVSLWDLNGDARPDIWVGNDFDDPDAIWLQDGAGGWVAAAPFPRYAHSTMGIDRGDVDGDGVAEYFATDMKPYQRDPATTAQWAPLMETGYQTRRYADPQLSENVLLMRAGATFRNAAYERRMDATGWSWSGKFGDLDNDGRLDLYVVNGMIAADLLDHLPGGELVEENRALRNTGAEFTLAAGWGLGSTRSGRGMSMADFDQDGDLDIVVNNLNSPAQLFENRLCDLGDSLAVDLRWPAAANGFALGAQVTLHTSRGPQVRDVRASSGYLSGDSTRLHFGLGKGAALDSLSVRWPDGAVSTVDNPPANQRVTITRTR